MQQAKDLGVPCIQTDAFDGGLSSPQEVLETTKDPNSSRRLQPWIYEVTDISSVPLLVQLLENEPSCRVKHRAVKALGALRDVRGLDVLTKISSDSKVPYYIRNAAMNGVDSIKKASPTSTHILIPETHLASLDTSLSFMSQHKLTTSSYFTTPSSPNNPPLKNAPLTPPHQNLPNKQHKSEGKRAINKIDPYFKIPPKKAKLNPPHPKKSVKHPDSSSPASTPKSSKVHKVSGVTSNQTQDTHTPFEPTSSAYENIGGYHKLHSQGRFLATTSRPSVLSCMATTNATQSGISLPSAYSTRQFSSSDTICGIGSISVSNTDSPPKVSNPLVPLSSEQQAVVALAMSGCSFFFTGRAGTGKSLVMREMVQQLRSFHGEQHVYVTASTGIAACNIGGTTVHAFAGVGLGDTSKEELAKKAYDNKPAARRWRLASVLLIDEVSMLSGSFFDKIEYVARVVREDSNPFGNLQVILCGDFFQLPPVVRPGDQSNGNNLFCFESNCWGSVIEQCLELKQVFRQRDTKFVEILDEVRIGKISGSAALLLQKCISNILRTDDGIQPTRLYPHKQTVGEENKRFLQMLTGEKHTFVAEDTGIQAYVEQLHKNCTAPTVLELKLNAQVMLIKNIDIEKEQVNGARGVVVAWEKPSEEDSIKFPNFKCFPVVKFASGCSRVITPEQWSMEQGGVTLCSRVQIPLDLAWALSIHKSQGMTIDKLEVGLHNIFEWGQAYVALSRATSLDKLHILGQFTPSIIRTHPKVIQFHSTFATT